MSREKIYTDEYCEPTLNEVDKLDYRGKKIINIFSKYNFNRILDVGCGDGNFSILLKKACKAKEVYGIEISKKGVESARSNGVKAFQLDIDREIFPFEDNYFDAIFAGEIIEHLFDTDHFLDEVHRTLVGGICVITTPNLSSWINRISLLFGFQPYATNCSLKYSIGHLYESPKGNKMGEADHKKVFVYRSLLKLLQIHKFTIINSIGANIDIPHNKRLPILVMKILDNIFSRFPSLTHSIIIVCKKEII